ncbi:protein of unknown function [Taphrina deformans PYCC 5710]|uniref:DUF1772 family protein n=1 Tax=Taphrina deformans (strain PYCC 5710 / ATCC 11124 / CBS 356.35 / IMI 108563 / JCM 9778 / NBRC 8474) TaxID=1097556 RepID=R4XDL4_TAPDE|nr:protein of unknown function [Taphrina deformans PYCC 5710]|eukprot:CCG81434.1 protein of unknown function [Taphrina deformans PYCC 5710]
MSQPIITTTTISSIKIISTCGLGLLAGFTLASPVLITPTLDALSSKSTASVLSTAQGKSWRAVSGCAALVSAMMGLSFMGGATAGGRHPYLMYVMAGSAAAGLAAEVLVQGEVRGIKGLVEQDGNGEAVVRGFVRLRRAGALVAGLFTAAFVVSVVGNYGDFY